MRILTHLRSKTNAAYNDTYHNKVQGRMWRGMYGTPYEERHDQNRPLGVTYSNIFPCHPQEAFTEGERYKIQFAAPEEDPLAYLAADLLNDPEFNVGEPSFEVNDVTALDPDVGEPGTSGTIETASGVCVRFDDDVAEEYDIDPHPSGKTFWRREHGTDPFFDAIERNLEWKHSLYHDEYLPGPAEFERRLLDGWELMKTFSVPLTVAEGVTKPYILSKWKFDYTVCDDHHRRHLNLALDTGIGERNGLGLGFINAQKAV